MKLRRDVLGFDFLVLLIDVGKYYLLTAKC